MFLVVSQSKYSRGKSGSISGVEHSVLHLQFPIIQQQTSTPKVGARLSLLKQGRDRRLSETERKIQSGHTSWVQDQAGGTAVPC